MTAAELQQYLHEHIPLTRAMQATVVSVSPEHVTLAAPLAPNTNHHATVFGGSAVTLAILAAWSALHVRLSADQARCRLVIQRNEMEYLEPIRGDFIARAALSAPDEWPRFRRILARMGKARISADAVLECDGKIVGRFRGEFVAIAGSTG